MHFESTHFCSKLIRWEDLMRGIRIESWDMNRELAPIIVFFFLQWLWGLKDNFHSECIQSRKCTILSRNRAIKHFWTNSMNSFLASCYLYVYAVAIACRCRWRWRLIVFAILYRTPCRIVGIYILYSYILNKTEQLYWWMCMNAFVLFYLEFLIQLCLPQSTINFDKLDKSTSLPLVSQRHHGRDVLWWKWNRGGG